MELVEELGLLGQQGFQANHLLTHSLVLLTEVLELLGDEGDGGGLATGLRQTVLERLQGIVHAQIEVRRHILSVFLEDGVGLDKGLRHWLRMLGKRKELIALFQGQLSEALAINLVQRLERHIRDRFKFGRMAIQKGVCRCRIGIRLITRKKSELI